jgi:SAM-dependent methyltransferase
MADIKTSKKAMRAYAVSWDKIVRSVWLNPYPESLSNELKKLNVKSILDCAGGTGFPSIELKQMGWDVSYSDGSNEMVSFCRNRIKEEALDIPAYSSRWEDLSKNIPHTYDALICAGNSFITIATYENSEYSTQQDSAKLRMQLAVAEFYKMLNKGGVLYIDLMKKESVAPEHPYNHDVTYDDKRILSTINYDPVRNIRTVFSTTISLVDGSEVDTITKFAPLYSEDLINLLVEAGFSRVEKSIIEGADIVDGFLAFKD